MWDNIMGGHVFVFFRKPPTIFELVTGTYTHKLHWHSLINYNLLAIKFLVAFLSVSSVLQSVRPQQIGYLVESAAICLCLTLFM